MLLNALLFSLFLRTQLFSYKRTKMQVSTTIIMLCAAALVVITFEVKNSSSTVLNDDSKTAESEPTIDVRDGDENSDDGDAELNFNYGDADQNGLDKTDKGAIEFLFGVSLLSLLFFVALFFCPPLCRQETKTLHRRYIDTQLQIGEL